MRLICSAISLTIAASSIAQAGDFIRQTQLGTGLVWDFHPSSTQGRVSSPISIDQGGSLFSLYTTADGDATPSLTKLDESTMGSAFPAVDLRITSLDPHIPARTRADQPFSVAIKRQGAKNKAISLRHTRTKYNPTTHSPGKKPESKHEWWQIPTEEKQNGIFYPSIPSADATQAEGEETFTTYAAGPTGNEVHPLKSASIQVWPVATVKIKGVEANKTYKTTEKLKNVSIQCDDLYPDSITYVQLYRGEERLGTLGRILPQTVIRFDSEVPQNQKIPLGDWSKTLRDGTYTLEVLHITPFNERKPERLAYISFVIDRGMHASGLVFHQFHPRPQ